MQSIIHHGTLASSVQKWEPFYNPPEAEFNDKIFGKNVLIRNKAKQISEIERHDQFLDSQIESIDQGSNIKCQIEDKINKLMINNIFQNRLISRKYCPLDGNDMSKININSIQKELNNHDKKKKSKIHEENCKTHSISSHERFASLLKRNSSTTPGKERHNQFNRKNAIYQALKIQENSNSNLILVNRSTVLNSMKPSQHSDIKYSNEKSVMLNNEMIRSKRGKSAIVKRYSTNYANSYN